MRTVAISVTELDVKMIPKICKARMVDSCD